MGIYDDKNDYMARYRDDQKDVRGQYVYLLQANGYHGLLSSIRWRCKIGLANNPERRLKELNSAQAPCKITGIRYIEVIDNVSVEYQLHQKFAKYRVYGEWFDFWRWEIILVNLAFDEYIKANSRSRKWIKRLFIVNLMILAFVASLIISVTLSDNLSGDGDENINNNVNHDVIINK
jgi:hypothetical protein